MEWSFIVTRSLIVISFFAIPTVILLVIFYKRQYNIRKLIEAELQTQEQQNENDSSTNVPVVPIIIAVTKISNNLFKKSQFLFFLWLSF